MNNATSMLIVTLVFLVIMIGIIVGAIFASENSGSSGGNTGNNQGTGCVPVGPIFKNSVPSYVRQSAFSNTSQPLANDPIPLDVGSSYVNKNQRVRSLPYFISTNHWISNACFGSENLILCYPYIIEINNDNLAVSWPNSGILYQSCGSASCPTGASDLSYISGQGNGFTISSFSEKVISCDIINVDALTATLLYQCVDNGSITIPLVKGCPYITCNVVNCDFALAFNFKVNLTQTTTYVDIPITTTTGFIIFMDKYQTMTSTNNVIELGKYNGIVRIAYYADAVAKNILPNYAYVYPVETTVNTSYSNNGTNTTVTTEYVWTVNTIKTTINTNVLMLALPSHNIINTNFESSQYDHPIIGPYRYLQANDNKWQLETTILSTGFQYPITNLSNSVAQIVAKEMILITKVSYSSAVEWMKWLGSIANLIMMAKNLNMNYNSLTNILSTNLVKIRASNGNLANFGTFIYEKVWGGIVCDFGINVCNGLEDNGNAFYDNHVAQFGYLLYAYAVLFYIDSSYIVTDKQYAMLFARTILNPAIQDTKFPLWRNMDWYTGYSLETGLSPKQINGKSTVDIGADAYGYFGGVLLGTVLQNDNLKLWATTMLASQINAINYYFQYTAYDKITVNPYFVQGTINIRNEIAYYYKTTEGVSTYPGRNASQIISVIMPFSQLSFAQIDKNWATVLKPYINSALLTTLPVDSFAYASAISSVNETSNNRQLLLSNLLSQENMPLDIGSTWSAIAYYIANN